MSRSVLYLILTTLKESSLHSDTLYNLPHIPLYSLSLLLFYYLIIMLVEGITITVHNGFNERDITNDCFFRIF